jgi:hypothetical protein
MQIINLELILPDGVTRLPIPVAFFRPPAVVRQGIQSTGECALYPDAGDRRARRRNVGVVRHDDLAIGENCVDRLALDLCCGALDMQEAPRVGFPVLNLSRMPNLVSRFRFILQSSRVW